MKIYEFSDLNKHLPALLIEIHIDKDSILGYFYVLSFNSGRKNNARNTRIDEIAKK